MEKKKIIAAALSLTLVFGAAGTLTHTAVHMFDSAIPASADYNSSVPYVDGHVSLDEETGVLTLSGFVTREQITEYWGNLKVRSIVAKEDCVLPSDCSYLFSFTKRPEIDVPNSGAASDLSRSGSGDCGVENPSSYYNTGSGDCGVENPSSYYNTGSGDCGVENPSSAVDYESYHDSFYELDSIDISKANTSRVENMEGMFSGVGEVINRYNDNYCNSINVSGIDTSNVTNMRHMFSSCKFVETIDVSSFNTKRVTDMSGMFDHCSKVKVLDVSGFDTSKTEDMGCMFRGCGGLKSINVSGFDTSKVTYMADMFDNCSNLTSIDLSSFNTANVKSISGMFSNCFSLTEIDVSNFDVSNVKDMTHLFNNCMALTTIYTSGDWNTKEGVSNFSMFNGSENLVGGNGTKCGFPNYGGEFACIDKEGQPGYFTYKKDQTGYTEFDAETGVLTLHGNITKKLIQDGYTSDTKSIVAADDCVFPPDCSDMFRKAYNEERPDGTCADWIEFSNVETIDISKADTSKVTNMNGMFELGGIAVGSYKDYTTINVSGIDTSNVEDMGSMFSGSKVTELDVSSFDTSKVTNMRYMFTSSKLKTIYASEKFDMSNVIDSEYMFSSEELVGGNGTKFDPSKKNGEYARIDKEGEPGYFTFKSAPEKPSLGNVNGDAAIDIEDAVMVINSVNGVKALTDEEFKNADVDGNGDVDIEDAVAIIAHVNGVNPIN